MVDRWLGQMEVIGPRRTAFGDVLLEPLEHGTDWAPDFELTVSSAKEWLLPQVETLYTYEIGSPTRVHEVQDSTRRVLFGVRPCDVSAIGVLDALMTCGPGDPYYVWRRRNTACVSLACEEVFSGHFCHLLGTGPSLGGEFDWQLTRLGDGWAVEVASETGRSLLEGVRDLVSPASEADGRRVADRHQEARESGKAFANLERVRSALRGRELKEIVWDGLISRCQGCGGCSFVCPTCACFTIVDVRVTAASGERQRRWDSCVLRGFTAMAGGFNPGESGWTRSRRRLHHKLAENTGGQGHAACVGCGRCVAACMGNASLRDVLERIAAEAS